MKMYTKWSTGECINEKRKSSNLNNEFDILWKSSFIHSWWRDAFVLRTWCVHNCLWTSSSTFNFNIVRKQNTTEQSKKKTTVKTLIFCTLSAVLFWLRGKSLWISSFIYSPGWIPCSLFNALSTALTLQIHPDVR